ncbi:MAG: rRNA methyltransferase [Gammaproteobacteria bacterium]|nr:MAG: rRNA methyltransferase [Gammaproteobacteria bacterium]
MTSNNKYPHTAFYGIGIMHARKAENIGTLWRSAYIMGASFIFTVDRQYKKQSSDVVTTPSRIPLYHYKDLSDLIAHLPYGAPLIGIEMTDKAVLVSDFEHPKRAVYLLGSETNGLSQKTIDSCHYTIKLPGNFSLNVAVAGSIVMHDRISKIPHVLPDRV